MILVTGATGVLGRVIALELVKKGRKVRACKRPGSDLSDVRKSYRFYTSGADLYFKQIDWVDVDFTDHDSIYRALQNIQEVYHCASKVSFDPKDYEEILETGIISTRNILTACINMPVKKFLFVSSAETLTINRENIETEIKKYDCKNKIYSPYLMSKYIAEKLVWDAYGKGLNTVIINPAMIIGTGNWEKENNYLSHIFFKSRFTFPGGTSCVDVRDVAGAAVSLMEKNVFGERFCISSENVLFKDLSSEIRKIMGLSEPTVISGTLLKLMKWLRLALKIIDRKAGYLTEENISFACKRNYYSGKKIKNRMAFTFYPVADSLQFHCRNYMRDKSEKKMKDV